MEGNKEKNRPEKSINELYRMQQQKKEKESINVKTQIKPDQNTVQKTSESIKDTRPAKRSSNVFYIIIILLLAGGLVVLGWLYYDLMKENTMVVVELKDLNSEKDMLTEQYNYLLDDYEGLRTDNDEINKHLDAEKEKIKKMLEELKNVKATNAYKISKYKKELGTLRDIMKSYIVQIDSLNTLNQKLIVENIQVKHNYEEVQQENVELSEKNVGLSEKVEIGSILNATNILATPINHKSKPVTKVNKVNKIKVCFTLRENTIAGSGLKDVFIRIARPDELILASADSDLFEYEDDLIVYSAMRQVEYNNNDVDMCIFWNNNQQLISGKYFVDIFIDGNLIGSITFSLK